MITWAICWMIVNMASAGKGIGPILMFAMFSDVAIFATIAYALNVRRSK